MTLHVDLNYRHIRAITLFQQIYRYKRETLRTLNASLDTIYATLVSVTNNINNNYIGEVISQEHYICYLRRAETISNTLAKIPRPLLLGHLLKQSDLRYTISYLNYQIVELVKSCGASCCYDVFNCLVGAHWDLGIKRSHGRLLNLYNIMFLPINVKLATSDNTDEIKAVKYSSFTSSMSLKINGAEITVPFYDRVLIIRGYFRDDPLNISRCGGTIEQKYHTLCETVGATTSAAKLQPELVSRYIGQISLRDFICCDINALIATMNNDLHDLDSMRSKPIGHVSEEFIRSKLRRQYIMLTLLLLDTNTHPHAKNIIATLMSNDNDATLFRILHWSVQKIFMELSKSVDKANIGSTLESALPYDVRIDSMKCKELIKRRAREKLKEAKGTREGSEKAIKYLDGLLQIPFGVYRKEKILRFMEDFCDTIAQGVRKTESEIDAMICSVDMQHLDQEWAQFKLDRKQYLTDTKATLDSCIYGQDEAKRRIESLVAQWINGEMSGVVFGFQGYPGTGKTTLARQGLSRCLKDEHGVPRPFYHISLGGSTGANMLIGHSYTYVGSQWGKLVDCLHDAKIMNPIIYFDELDKVSESPQGDEIIRILTHLTDPEQNEEITDRYFNLPLDLSKALIIFSYNNRDKVDPVLMDRIYEVRFKQYCKRDKVYIASHYILPRILKSAGFSADSLIFSEATLGYIVESYTVEAGVRDMKDKIMEIVRELNLRRIYDADKYKLPYTINEELVNDILGRREKINITEIPKVAQVGWVNGLYATTIGTGGITIIQAFDTPSDKKYSLELTGKLGDVMKESVRCAKTIGMRIFNDVDRKRISEMWSENALHIHFPAAGTAKDGPSAGAAITTSLISYFSRMPVRHYIAMTGEIDLYGNVCAIGGLQCKIEGAQRAGVRLVLIPRSNEAVYSEFSADYNVRVIAVDNISQIIRVALIGATDTNFKYMHDVRDATTANILDAISIIEKDIGS